MKKSNIKTMKKYLVSLALKVPCNFEIEVNAKSDKEALKKHWENGIMGMMKIISQIWIGVVWN